MFAQLSVKIKMLSIAAALILVSLIGWYIINRLYQSNNPIQIYRLPADTEISIDGTVIKGDRTNLPNGTYKIVAKKDGFLTSEDTLIVNDYTDAIVAQLLPESDEAIDWYEDNQDKYIEMEGIIQNINAAADERFAEKNPIVKNLPIDEYVFQVGYVIDPDDTSGSSIRLTVYGIDGYRNAAIRAIYDEGFDPAEYMIDFKDDYVNPFEVGDE